MDLTFEDQKMIGEHLASHPKLANARVAVLHKKNHNPSLLIDVHAFNKGHLIAEFSNEKDALDWLKEKI